MTEVAEQLVREHETIEKAIVAHCPVPVFVCDSAGRWFITNTPLQRLLASDRSALIRDGWLAVVAPDERQDTLEKWQVLIAARQPESKLKLTFLAPDGRTVSAYTTLIRLTNGNYIGFVMPICAHPSGCPMHGFLLHNVEATLPPKPGPEAPTRA